MLRDDVIVLCCALVVGVVCLWVLFLFVVLALKKTTLTLRCAHSKRSRVCRHNALVTQDTRVLTAHRERSTLSFSLSLSLSSLFISPLYLLSFCSQCQ